MVALRSSSRKAVKFSSHLRNLTASLSPIYTQQLQPPLAMKPGLFTALALGCLAMGSPIASTNLERSGPMSDLEVLQYASTLENLEAALYEQALAKFTADDLANAGFAGWVRSRVSQIAEHESSHVRLLSGALGNNSVPPCQYAFPFEDPATFIGFATAIENIGVSAYVGANQYLRSTLQNPCSVYSVCRGPT